MYAQLGNTVFENLRGFNDFNRKGSATYAEHKTLTGKPRLQATGNDLDELSLSMRLHASFCSPLQVLNTLKKYRNTNEVLSLLLGNGRLEGKFVITDIQEVVEDADAKGNVFSYMVNCTLKEYLATNALQAEQNANRLKAAAVGDKKPVTKLKINPLTSNQDIAKSVSAINIHTNLINETVEQKGGVNSVTNRNTIAQSADSIKKFSQDLQDKYGDIKGTVNDKASTIRDVTAQIYTTAGQLRSTLGAPADFLAYNKSLLQSVTDLKILTRPIVLKSITGQ